MPNPHTFTGDPDKVVINNLTYKIKSRVFKCDGKIVKVVLKKVDNEITNS